MMYQPSVNSSDWQSGALVPSASWFTGESMMADTQSTMGSDGGESCSWILLTVDL
jgi:hypothetical protein